MTDAFDNSLLLQSTDRQLAVRVSRHGGAIVEAHWAGVPILRPYAGNRAQAFAVLKAASFPLVPFGNRLEGNEFEFAGVRHALAPNLDWDAHYLHGDGWLGDWAVTAHADDGVTLAFDHPPRAGTPYVYTAEQAIRVADNGFAITLAVTNRGPVALPFGIGHHPFFPMDSTTTLTTTATSHWTEKAGWLPDQQRPIPPELDFAVPRPLPRHYVNNGLEGWSRHARIAWPATGMALTMSADPVFGRAFIFVSDDAFEPGVAHDYFCLEPMSHTAGGHLQPDLGGLQVLQPGETLAGSVRFAVERTAPAS
jgi:aldose 1-epimerase